MEKENYSLFSIENNGYKYFYEDTNIDIQNLLNRCAENKFHMLDSTDECKKITEPWFAEQVQKEPYRYKFSAEIDYDNNEFVIFRSPFSDYEIFNLDEVLKNGIPDVFSEKEKVSLELDENDILKMAAKIKMKIYLI